MGTRNMLSSYPGEVERVLSLVFCVSKRRPRTMSTQHDPAFDYCAICRCLAGLDRDVDAIGLRLWLAASNSTRSIPLLYPHDQPRLGDVYPFAFTSGWFTCWKSHVLPLIMVP